MLLAPIKKLVSELNGFKDLNFNSLYAELTERECEVLNLIEQGLSNQEIATALTIELGTVKNHVHNILDKLDVRTRKHAAIIARQALAHRSSNREQPRAAQLSADLVFPAELTPIYQNNRYQNVARS